MQHRLLGITVLAASLAISGCGGDEGKNNSDGAGGTGSGASSGPNLVGAQGVRITQIAIYQGSKRVLMQDGADATSTVPLIAGRDAVVRVFYAVDPAYNGSEVTGRLTIEGGDDIVVTGVLSGSSTDPLLGSTVNFTVPGDRVGTTFTYSVGLLQEGAAAADNPTARYPAADTRPIPVEGAVNTLRVKLVPFRYEADGSGRLPDVSAEQVERYRVRFLQLYPVSNVEVTVREEIAWNQTISPTGDGWYPVGFALSNARTNDGTPPEMYYHGIFNPASSFGAYCGGGCLLGVTLLNDSPPDEGQVQLRLALGVGFSEVASETATHEIGHAHGRMHADCGFGLDPNSIDPNFPHAGGSIGGWAYDIVNKALVDPEHTDFMGYCENTWISDYNYIGLFNRGKNVNEAYRRARLSAAVEYEIIAVDGEGKTAWNTTPSVHRGELGGDRLDVRLVTAQGLTSTVRGHYFRYDHLPGGWVLFPKPKVTVRRAEFVARGTPAVAER
jgi:hypothetical protein